MISQYMAYNLLIFNNYHIIDKLLVLRVGIEPTLCCQNWILNPARLPVPPPKQVCKSIKSFIWNKMYQIIVKFGPL